MNYRKIEICGVPCLAEFSNNDECMSASIVFHLGGGGVRAMDQLIPHGLSPRSWDEPVKEDYIAAAIETIETWMAEGRHEPIEYRENEKYYSPSGFRGFSSVPITFESIEDVDLLAAFCRVARLQDILNVWSPAYLSAQQKKQFAKLAKEWVKSHQGYLDTKASDFADFWASKVNTLGSNGVAFHDRMHAMTRSNKQPATTEDVEKFRRAIKEWAIGEFGEGCIPFLATDYGPEAEMMDVLDQAGLDHLGSLLPWKTLLHLNFEDRPQI